MKTIYLILLLFGFTTIEAQSLEDTLLSTTYSKVIKVLANDSFMGRPSSSAYEKKAAEFIQLQLSKQQKFTPKAQLFKYNRKPSDTASYSINVYCFVNNKADSTILIGAHYDHIGLGSGLSKSYGKLAIHNGADDNASGVALVIGLHKNLKYWESKKYNYLFVFYSAHEIGLFGSSAFAEMCNHKFKPICLVLNFDMIGRLDPSTQLLNIYGKHTLKNEKVKTDSLMWDGKISANESEKIYQTDAGAFALQGIPSLSFTTGLHDDYHKITDDENQINYSGILAIQRMIEALLLQLEK